MVIENPLLLCSTHHDSNDLIRDITPGCHSLVLDCKFYGDRVLVHLPHCSLTRV